MVALDARVAGVDVPSHLGKDPQLRLNLSYRFGLPLAIEAWGVRATLTFAGVPYSCHFPWAAIFLLVSHVSGQPYLFPDDIPAELLSQAPEMANALPPHSRLTGKKPPKLQLVRSQPSPEAADPEPTTTAAPAAPAAKPSAAKEPATAPSKRRGSRAGTAAARKAAPPQAPEASASEPPAAPTGAATPGSAADKPTPRQRGHLRLIK